MSDIMASGQNPSAHDVGYGDALVEAARLRDMETESFLSEKKLLLVLDLDHTLISACNVDLLEDQVIDLPKEDLKEALFSFECDDNDDDDDDDDECSCQAFLIKLRPFVRTFLEEASTMFRMCIYTNATADYAQHIAEVLDPEGKYFNSGVITREDSIVCYEKDLDVVLGRESTIVIVDDTVKVWPRNKANLIPIESYDYFSCYCQKSEALSSYSPRKTDECESGGHLKAVLEVLKKVHQQFFDPEGEVDLAARDVRQIIKGIADAQVGNGKGQFRL